jgi:excisionase family DNA binding protein
MPTARLVRVSEAAELLGVSDETVYRMARRRQIAYLRNPVTGHWLFPTTGIEAYIAANTVPARPMADLTPAPRERKRRERTVATPASAGDEPWRGSVFGDRKRPRKSAAAGR